MAAAEGIFDVVLTMINDKFDKRDPYFFITILISVFVVILSIIFLIFRGKSSSRRSILLVGLCDSGKTTLFSRLVHGKVFPTQTSVKENSGIYTVPSEKKSTVNIIDIPGYDRLRYKFFDQFKSSARAVIFVLDSLTFQKEIKDVAELMYNVLTDATVVQNSLPILVACNKDDQALAKGPKIIQSALEKELNNVRMTRSASLSTTDGNKSASQFLGKRNQDFTFAQTKPVRVEFVKCSAKGVQSNEANLGELNDWIVKIA